MSEHPTTGLPSSDHADAAPLDRRRVLLGAAGAALAGTFVAAGASSPAGAQAPDVDGGTVTAAGQWIRPRHGTLGDVIFNPTVVPRDGELVLISDYGVAFRGDGTRNLAALKPTLGSGQVLCVWDFGALGNGAADDAPAINAAITAANAAGGATVLVPAGIYNVASTVMMKSNVRLVGAGKYATLIRQVTSGFGVIEATGVTNIEIADLGVEGTNGSAGTHGIRSSDLAFARFHNLRIFKTDHYGIGLQCAAGKAIRDVEISSCDIEDTGGDGVDIKNKGNANSHIRILGCTVRRFGRRTDGQAGLDLRGVGCVVSDCIVSEFGDNGRPSDGIRMRFGETTDVHGLGAHHAQISDCQTIASGPGTTIGFHIGGTGAQLSNCQARNGAMGFLVIAPYVQLSNCQAVDASGTGFFVQTGATPNISADRITVIGCSSLHETITAAANHFRVGANEGVYQSCLVKGSGAGRGVLFVGAAGPPPTGATGNRFLNGVFYDTGPNWDQNGTNAVLSL